MKITELKSKNRVQLIAIIEELLEEKKTWQKICAFEKIKWDNAVRLVWHEALDDTKEHIKNLKKLAGE